MERNLSSSSQFETPTIESAGSDTKKDKKKSTTKEAAPVATERSKAERDLVRALDRLPLFEKPKEQSVELIDAESQLDDHETIHAQQVIAEAHLKTIAETDPETQVELEPATDFLERVQAGTDPEVAYAEVAEEYQLETVELDANTDEIEPDETPQPEIEPSAAEADIDADGIIDPRDPNEGTVNWQSAGGGSGGSGGGSGRTTPPSSQPPSGGGSTPRPITVAASPIMPSPNTLPPAANTYYAARNRHNASDLWLGGIVGYFIGRRRGRIKTEKKLLPVQQQLEKQVSQLEQTITYKEKQLVAAKARHEERSEVQANPVERPLVVPATPERRPVAAPKPRAERLAHMIVTNEAVSRPKRAAAEQVDLAMRAKAESVKSLPRAELLEVADKVIVEGASLRKIYESRLIGEKQLRFLVSEHLQGRDIRKDLRREMVEREIDFERDPILRDRIRSRLASDSSSAGLQAMLAEAGVTEQEDDRDQVRQAAADKKQAQALARAKQKRQNADAAMVTIIVVLAVAVALLAIYR